MMINNSIFSKAGVPFYGRLLKVASSAQKTTAANIANVATPGYGAKEVNFIDEMRKSLPDRQASNLRTTDPRHLPPNPPDKIVKIEDASGDENSSGINNIDIEKEMGNLAENQMMYEFGARKLGRTFGVLRMAIRGKVQ